MLTQLLYRLRREASRFGAPRRLEICPPAMLVAAPATGWRAGLRDWLSTGWHAPAEERRAPAEQALQPRFCKVRDEFLQAVADIRTQQVGMLQGRIRIARSLRELWHLRPEVFKLVALHFNQAEAQCRLDRLNRHFPTRAPRSGFASLDSAAAGDARPRR